MIDMNYLMSYYYLNSMFAFDLNMIDFLNFVFDNNYFAFLYFISENNILSYLFYQIIRIKIKLN